MTTQAAGAGPQASNYAGKNQCIQGEGKYKDMRSHDEYEKSNTPFMKHTNTVSPKCKRRQGHTSHTNVTDGPFNTDKSGQTPGC